MNSTRARAAASALVIETVSEDGEEFTLFGLRRIDEERAVVTGQITGSCDGRAASSWFEPGYFFSAGGYEFSRVALIDDGVRHLPVRDEDHCLCSLSPRRMTTSPIRRHLPGRCSPPLPTPRRSPSS